MMTHSSHITFLLPYIVAKPQNQFRLIFIAVFVEVLPWWPSLFEHGEKFNWKEWDGSELKSTWWHTNGRSVQGLYDWKSWEFNAFRINKRTGLSQTKSPSEFRPGLLKSRSTKTISYAMITVTVATASWPQLTATHILIPAHCWLVSLTFIKIHFYMSRSLITALTLRDPSMPQYR